MMKKNARIGMCILITAALSLAGCSGTESPGQSGEKKMLGFTVTVSGQAIQGAINETAHTVALTLPAGTVVTALAPVITLSDKAAVVPASGAAQDFTNPVEYTVTAEDGTTQVYTVTVTVEPAVEAPADKTALNAAITAANSAKTGVVVDSDAANVVAGTQWVTQAALDTLNAAIGAAETIAAKEGATQAEVDAGVTALTTATATFTAAKQAGAKPGTAALTLNPPAEFTDLAQSVVDAGPAVTIYRQGSEDTSVTVTVDTTGLEGAAYNWVMDNKSVGTGTDITITASDYFPGTHYLSLEVTKAGAVWSRELTVAVDSGSKGE
jgi:Fe-S cluster assembly iron-binding protein IscA